MKPGPRRSLLVPEVVQTSAMDCGPAALAAAAAGLGKQVSYGRLREACQTDVDGTSISTLEDIARALGLGTLQSMAPLDHLLLPETEALPAIIVVVLEGGMTHFVVLWRVHGPWVQLMDPAVGRRWVRRERFLEDVFLHEERLPVSGWIEWASMESWRDAVLRRARRLGMQREARELYDAAKAGGGWRGFARLDAAIRFVEDVASAGGVGRGAAAAKLAVPLARGETDVEIPKEAWSVREAPPRDGAPPDAEPEVFLRGAVFVTLKPEPAPDAPAVPVPPALAAAVAEKPVRPWLEVARWTLRGGVLGTVVLALATVVAAAGTVVEGVVLRALLEAGEDLALVPARLAALGFLVAFLAALLLVELGVAGGLARLGRQLETRMRMALAEKVPRLSDRYFQTRPVSDMAERGHSLHQLRLLPRLLGECARAALGLAITAGAIVWIDPASLPLAATAAAGALIVPLLFVGRLAETDLRIRTHTGALGRFYLDALLGLAPLRAHAAERVVRREHESLLAEWARATAEFVRNSVRLDFAQAAAGLLFAFLLVRGYAERGQSPTTVLLLAYWALAMPVLGDEVARVVRQLPLHRNLFLRFLEPLRTPEEAAGAPLQDTARAAAPHTGADISIEGASVVAAGHPVLDGIDLRLPSGSHVAVVGASGAGKSSLTGLLLGWHTAAAGRVLVDGEPLDRARLERLRRATVWVDPSVRLWNRSLLENVAYGASQDGPLPVAEILAEAELHRVVDRLPQGLQTDLGEGGGLLSGGEGQRVRFARGLARQAPRLVVLDEPFRGLPHDTRAALLARARRRWKDATLLWVTHDVAEAQSMERVLVLDGGRIVEDGPPRDLAARAGSRFRALLDAEDAVRRAFWDDPAWRRLRLEDGRVVERARPGAAT